jgi:hypothetical protein
MRFAEDLTVRSAKLLNCRTEASSQVQGAGGRQKYGCDLKILIEQLGFNFLQHLL